MFLQFVGVKLNIGSYRGTLGNSIYNRVFNYSIILFSNLWSKTATTLTTQQVFDFVKKAKFLRMLTYNFEMWINTLLNWLELLLTMDYNLKKWKKLKLNFSANIAEYLPVLSKVGAENSWSSRVGLAGKGESDFKRTFQGQANILQQATGIEWVQANQFLKLFLLTGTGVLINTMLIKTSCI